MLAAGLFGLLWLTAIAGDPTEGFAFFVLVFAAPLLVGLPEGRRRLLFGIVILLVGVVGLGIGLEGGNGIVMFVPVLMVGTALFASELQHWSNRRPGVLVGAIRRGSSSQ